MSGGQTLSAPARARLPTSCSFEPSRSSGDASPSKSELSKAGPAWQWVESRGLDASRARAPAGEAIRPAGFCRIAHSSAGRRMWSPISASQQTRIAAAALGPLRRRRVLLLCHGVAILHCCKIFYMLPSVSGCLRRARSLFVGGPRSRVKSGTALFCQGDSEHETGRDSGHGPHRAA